MSHSKTTKNYKLPLFEPTDRPAWLTDFNGAMQTVDSTLKEFEGGIAGGGLPISGGTMQGAIDMGGNAITEVQEVELPESGDGLYVGSVIQPAGTGGARITGVTGGGAAVVKADTQSTYTQLKVGSPSTDNDAATKAYVDANKGITQTAADGRYLKLAGGTLTGPLTLSGSPTSDLQAATKGYVDANKGITQTAADGRYLKLAGGTLTGPLTLSGNPTSDLQAATKGYVDSNASGWVLAYTLPLTSEISATTRIFELSVPLEDMGKYSQLKCVAHGWGKVTLAIGSYSSPTAYQFAGVIGNNTVERTYSCALNIDRVKLDPYAGNVAYYGQTSNIPLTQDFATNWAFRCLYGKSNVYLACYLSVGNGCTGTLKFYLK